MKRPKATDLQGCLGFGPIWGPGVLWKGRSIQAPLPLSPHFRPILAPTQTSYKALIQGQGLRHTLNNHFILHGTLNTLNSTDFPLSFFKKSLLIFFSVSCLHWDRNLTPSQYLDRDFGNLGSKKVNFGAAAIFGEFWNFGARQFFTFFLNFRAQKGTKIINFEL